MCPIGPLTYLVGPCDLLLEAEGVFAGVRAGVFPEFSTPRRVGEGPNASHPQPPFSRDANLLTTFRTQEKDDSCLPSRIFGKLMRATADKDLLCAKNGWCRKKLQINFFWINFPRKRLVEVRTSGAEAGCLFWNLQPFLILLSRILHLHNV